jgi:glucose/arabinose dehydrogenase
MAARPVLSIVLLSAALAALVAPAAHATVQLPSGFIDQEMASGLHDPTSFTFLPDGRILALEQFTGEIRLWTPGSSTFATLISLPNLVAGAERGALAIAVDARWPVRPYVYVFHSTNNLKQRLVRYTAFGELTARTSRALALGSMRVVLDGLPDENFNHNGGALRFGPDSMLYLSLGDDNHGCPAQDSSSLHGCILRMDVHNLPAGLPGAPPRGDITPADNPWVGSADPDARLEYAYGLRNPFRFQIDPVDGALYVSDVGEDRWEEMDVIRSADNAGWPYREGPVSYSYAGCSEPQGFTAGASYREPIDSYGHDEGLVVISAGAYRKAVYSPSWPASWDGNVFYADFFSGFMRMLRRQGNTYVRATAPGQPDPDYWATGLVDPVEFQWGPDGQLWWLSLSEGRIHRISAQAVAGVEPQAGAPRMLLTAMPNPTSGAARFACTLPHAGRMRLAVYDASGRRVVTVADQSFAAGRHVLEWNGRDAANRELSVGVYVVALDLDGRRVTQRLVRGH